MLKIAACGNMVFQEGDLSSSLQRCAQALGIEEPYVREFASPVDLIDACTNVPADTEPLDLILCAANLPGISAFQLTRELRDADIVPHDMDVVVCAPDETSAYDAYANGARGYLTEPVSQADFDRVVGARLRQASRVHESCALVRCRNRVRRLAFDRITYVETSGHDQLFHVLGEREPSAVRGSSKTVFSLLEGDNRFFKAGSSYIVNLDFVRSMATRIGAITFADGSQVPVPVRARKTLEEALCARGKAVL